MDKISHIKDYKNGGIYDCGNHLTESTLRRILKNSDVVIVPSFYDHITLLNTVASMKIVHQINPYAKVIVVFNRLAPTDERREKDYTAYALNRLKKMIFESGIQFILHDQYIRQNFAFFRYFEGGQYLLDQFFTDDAKEDQLLNAIIDETDEDTLKARHELALDNLKHLENINYLYLRDHKPKQLTKNVDIRREEIYSKDAV